jgi:hypothetical protein
VARERSHMRVLGQPAKERMGIIFAWDGVLSPTRKVFVGVAAAFCILHVFWNGERKYLSPSG